MSNWTAGWNQPGCLPDTSGPLPEFDSWKEAQQFLLSELDAREEEQEDIYTTATLMAAWFDLLNAEEDEPCTVVTETNPPLAWWIDISIPVS